MGRFGRTWELTKGSWAILQKDKELAWIPLISAVLCLAVAAACFLPFLVVTDDSANGEGFQPGAMGYVMMVVATVVITFINTYFTGALVCGALERIRGGDPTLGSAFRGAQSHFHRLAPWALFAATVSLVLQVIRNIRFVGPIISRLLGLAWELITFLTVPILIVEDLGPIDALKRSAELFKRTWGENVIVQFGFGLVGIVAMIPGILVGGALAASGTGVLVVLGVGLIVASVVVVSVVMSALSGIFKTALYLYAAEGTLVPEYGAVDFSTAFQPKR
jgi:Family of unknown function (DUF6159)